MYIREGNRYADIALLLGAVTTVSCGIRLSRFRSQAWTLQ